MKKLALLLSALLVVAGASFAGDEKAKGDKAGKTHDAEIVSVDSMAKTITIKGDPSNKTLTVDTSAAETLKNLKAGDKVKLTFKESATGSQETVTAIEKKPIQ